MKSKLSTAIFACLNIEQRNTEPNASIFSGGKKFLSVKHPMRQALCYLLLVVVLVPLLEEAAAETGAFDFTSREDFSRNHTKIKDSTHLTILELVFL